MLEQKDDFFETDDMLKAFRSLFEGIVKMRKVNVVHQDIKAANTVYKNDLNRVFFIDLGLSISDKDIFKQNNSYIHNWDFYRYPWDWKLGYMISNYDCVKKEGKDSRYLYQSTSNYDNQIEIMFDTVLNKFVAFNDNIPVPLEDLIFKLAKQGNNSPIFSDQKPIYNTKRPHWTIGRSTYM